MKINIIVFRLSDQTYAFQLDKIPLVIGVERINSIANEAAEIPEKVNYMFEEIKIFNLHKILGVEQKPILKSSKLLIGEYANSSVGCFVDKVTSVMKISDTDIHQTSGSVGQKYVVGEINNGIPIKLLDIDKILESEVLVKILKEK